MCCQRVLCRRLPDFKDQQASNSAFRSGSSLPSPAPSPPPLLPSRISGKKKKKGNNNYKNTFEVGGGSQLQTGYETTLRHDQGREGRLGGRGQKKNRKNVSKTTHFTLTPPKFSASFQFVSRHRINISIFFSPLHPTAITVDTKTLSHHQHHHDHDFLPRNPALHPPDKKERERGAPTPPLLSIREHQVGEVRL